MSAPVSQSSSLSDHSASYAARCRIDPRPPRPASQQPLCDKDDPVQIQLLAECMEALPTVAAAYYDEWREGYQALCDVHSAASCAEYHAREYCSPDGLNTTLVALIDGKCAAAVVIATEDVRLGTPYYGVTPWLTCVYVLPAFRGRGLVKVLVEAVERRCREWGFGHVWLLTGHLQDVYRKLGYRSIETIDTWKPNVFYTVMRKDFAQEGRKPLTEQDAKDSHKLIHPERH